MTIWTLLRYLLGNREAILKIGSTPGALWVGLVFVFSAALAREYDGADLLHEPWHLVLPLGASLVTSFLLFCLVFSFTKLRQVEDVYFLSGYRSFLTLYWMTAPLAWLYAIPVERVLSPGEATQANLNLLGVVALWRVLLMIRVVTVLFGASVRSATVLVMFFADSVALVVLFSTPIPIVEVMSGIRLTESEGIIRSTALAIGFLSIITWPIWLLGLFAVGWWNKPHWSDGLADATSSPVRVSVIALAVVSVAGWLFVLPSTQPEQQRRHRAEQLLRSGEIEEALAFMSAYGRDDFPPHWDPPPRLAYRETQPSMPDVMEQVLEDEPASWVRFVFIRKYRNYINDRFVNPNSQDADAKARGLRILRRLPEGRTLLDDEYAHGYFWSFAEEHPESADDVRSLLPESSAPDYRFEQDAPTAVEEQPIDTPTAEGNQQ